MARKQIIRVIDDLDGKTEGAKEVEFSLDGVHYTIDLADANAGKLRAALAPYVAKATRVGKPQRRGNSAPGRNPENALIREWAADRKIAVSPRGRIAAEVVEAYRNRNAVPSPPPAPEPKPATAKAKTRPTKVAPAKATDNGKVTVVPAKGETAKKIREWWKNLGPDKIVSLNLPAYYHRGNVPTAVEAAYKASLTPAG